MSKALETLLQGLKEALGSDLLFSRMAVGELTVEIPADKLLPIGRRLRDEFGFEQLMDVCGVDYAAYGKADWQTEAANSGFSRGVDYGAYHDPEVWQVTRRFAVVYHLLSLEHNRRLRVRVFADDDPPRVDSVMEIWDSANWFEREAFDLYGILFNGHPDLRRILTDYGFIGHPFRKDFPLSGEVEMRYDPELGRVIYQPVSIEPRILVPRVLRHDNRYQS